MNSTNSIIEGIDDVTDHIANRVSLCTILGSSLGLISSTLNGINGRQLVKPMLHAGVSSALAMTACFMAERLVHVAASSYSSSSFCELNHGNSDDDDSDSDRENIKDSNRLSFCACECVREIGDGRSHVLGGVIGGGIVSKLYTFRALPGVLLFTPIMLVVYGIEIKVNEYREERIKAITMSSLSSK